MTGATGGSSFGGFRFCGVLQVPNLNSSRLPLFNDLLPRNLLLLVTVAGNYYVLVLALATIISNPITAAGNYCVLLLALATMISNPITAAGNCYFVSIVTVGGNYLLHITVAVLLTIVSFPINN
jgi:hypothetical protein